jgi:hypothetical protein
MSEQSKQFCTICGTVEISPGICAVCSVSMLDLSQIKDALKNGLSPAHHRLHDNYNTAAVIEAAPAMIAAIKTARARIEQQDGEIARLREALTALCNGHRAALYPAEFVAARAALEASR